MSMPEFSSIKEIIDFCANESLSKPLNLGSVIYFEERLNYLFDLFCKYIGTKPKVLDVTLVALSSRGDGYDGSLKILPVLKTEDYTKVNFTNEVQQEYAEVRRYAEFLRIIELSPAEVYNLTPKQYPYI